MRLLDATVARPRSLSSRLSGFVLLGFIGCDSGSPSTPDAGVLDASGEDASGGGGPDGRTDTGPDAEADAGIDYTPEPPVFGSFEFSPCRFFSAVDCLTFVVPLDHQDERAGTLEMVAFRVVHTSTRAALGTLAYSSGGPGGVVGPRDLLELQSAIGPELAAQFDLVAWTQRATFASGQVDCGNRSSIYLSGDRTPDDAQEELALDEHLASFAADCEAAARPLLPHVGPVDHARDLEWLRMGIGLDELFFYAPSYASIYATVYAELFPTRLRRAVLDSPISPSTSLIEWSQGQFAAGLARLEQILADCETDPDCVFQPEGNKRQGLLDLHASLDGSEVIEQTHFELAMVWAPYVFGGELEYPTATLAMLEDVRLGNRKSVDNVLAEITLPADEGAFLSQVCMHDRRPTLAELDALRDELTAQMAPLAGYFASFVRTCAHWPFEGKRPAGPIAARANTFLVLAGARDYAIPLAWAEQLAAELEAPLVVSSAYGHGMVGDDMPACARRAVVEWLLHGTEVVGCE